MDERTPWSLESRDDKSEESVLFFCDSLSRSLWNSFESSLKKRAITESIICLDCAIFFSQDKRKLSFPTENPPNASLLVWKKLS